MPFARISSARVLLVAGFIAVIFGSSASAQMPEGTPSGACFDVVRSLNGEVGGAILVNRCNGRTWILSGSRTRHGDHVAYRWVPIATGDTEAAVPPSTPVRPHVHARANPNSDKCFIFQGRHYCE
jgi:hypothetical protein